MKQLCAAMVTQVNILKQHVTKKNQSDGFLNRSKLNINEKCNAKYRHFPNLLQRARNNSLKSRRGMNH